ADLALLGGHGELVEGPFPGVAGAIATVASTPGAAAATGGFARLGGGVGCGVGQYLFSHGSASDGGPRAEKSRSIAQPLGTPASAGRRPALGLSGPGGAPGRPGIRCWRRARRGAPTPPGGSPSARGGGAAGGGNRRRRRGR